MTRQAAEQKLFRPIAMIVSTHREPKKPVEVNPEVLALDVACTKRRIKNLLAYRRIKDTIGR